MNYCWNRFHLVIEGSADGTEMWFLPFSVTAMRDRVFVPGYEAWFIRSVQKLLENDKQTLALIRRNPFPDQPPRSLRATYYRYEFGKGKTWWKRTRVGEYLPAIALRDVG